MNRPLLCCSSSVSLQIKGLEEVFCTRLLNRRKRTAVSLTEAGRLFLSEAVAAIRRLERGLIKFHMLDLPRSAVVQTCGTWIGVSGSLRCLQAPSIAFQIPSADPP